jgi:hypothetical protein
MSLIKSYLHEQMNTFTPDPRLEMLMQREQLMEDIISIITDYSDSGHICEESSDILQEVLCDAVCKNFPAQ